MGSKGRWGGKEGTSLHCCSCCVHLSHQSLVIHHPSSTYSQSNSQKSLIFINAAFAVISFEYGRETQVCPSINIQSHTCATAVNHQSQTVNESHIHCCCCC